MELARAQIAYQLKKEYQQDEELEWGCLVDKKVDNKLLNKDLGPTFKKKMIHEVIVTTVNQDKQVHIAPMGIKFVDHANRECIQISPFKPSQTLDNLLVTKKATINFIDDVRYLLE